MKPPEPLRAWPDYKYLFAWLETATKGLSVEARARIREEITDHFHQALADGLDAGLSEDAAAQRVVADLGSPRVARRAFRRTYLTRWQAHTLRGFVDLPEPPTSSGILSVASAAKQTWRGSRRVLVGLRIYLVLAVAAMTALQHDRLSPRDWQLRLGIVVLMAAANIVFAAVPHIFRRGRERLAIGFGASADLALWSGFMIAPAIGPLARATHTVAPRLWLVGVLIIFWGIVHTPLVLKLRRRRPESA